VIAVKNANVAFLVLLLKVETRRVGRLQEDRREIHWR